MPHAALSTGWMRGHYEMLAELVASVATAGFHSLELSRNVTVAMLAAFPPGSAPVLSLHAPCPNAADSDDGIQLAATEEDQRRAAVALVKATIDAAVRYGAGVVVVHVGTVLIPPMLERRLRELYRQGAAGTRAYEQALQDITVARVLRREPHYGAALRSLDELCQYARPRGVRLGLENRVGYNEIPGFEEMKDLLHTYDASVVGYWHDVGHAHVLETLGFATQKAWLEACGQRLIGLHLHDVQGIDDHRAPGSGDVDLTMLRPHLRPDVIRVCEFDRTLSLADIRAGHEHLIRLGLVDAPRA